MTAAGTATLRASAPTILVNLVRSGVLPDPDYALNHVVNRIPLVGARMRAYAALGVKFDERSSAHISLGVEMWVGRRLAMGARSTIGQRCYIDARAGIRVDSDVSISREAALLTATHIPDDPEFLASLAPVHLERHCWIGMRALVLPGVRVGEGAVVGAGAIVTGDVAPYTIVAGVPAKVLRKRWEPLSYRLDWRPSWH
jgi:acetyltransferase-like isoleucine patch superfamily enzyme